MSRKYYIFQIIILLIGLSVANAQEPQKVEIRSGYTEKRPELPDAIIYTKDASGQVYITHDGVEMWCDQAYLYPQENFVRAYGNVFMTQGDTISLRSNYTEYNGNSQLAFARGDVLLKEPQTTLESEVLYFDRVRQQAYYDTGGTVRDSSSVLYSTIGRYFTDSKKYQFLDKVHIDNPDYILDSEQVDFYSESGDAYLYGPSTITGENSKVYSERGFFQTRESHGYFVQNARIDYDDRVLFGDSIYFNRNTNFASATNNIRVYDSINESKVTGHYAEVYKDKDSVIITKNPIIATKQQADTLYVNANKIVITGKPQHRIMNAYPDARFIKIDSSGIEEPMSGKADSIYVNEKNGLMKLLRKPVVWSGENQMTGDTIQLFYNNFNKEMDTLKVHNNAFIIQPDSLSGGFNQIKGQYLLGLFTDNKIDTIKINRNTEVLFYTRDEKDELIGIDKTLSSNIEIYIEENDIRGVRFIRNAEGKLYPESKLPKNARLLPGFIWRGEERIKELSDLLKGKPEIILPKIKGIEPPNVSEEFFNENTKKSEDDPSVTKVNGLLPKDSELKN